jgi:hypothetical protein
MNNIDIKDIIKRLYEYGFRFIESKSIVIIYINGKYRFISLYNDKKYWNKDAGIKCWCEVDINNDNINIYKTEPELKDDETIDDIFCGYDDNRIELLITNVKNDIPNIKSNSIKYVNNDMIIITVIYE